MFPLRNTHETYVENVFGNNLEVRLILNTARKSDISMCCATYIKPNPNQMLAGPYELNSGDGGKPLRWVLLCTNKGWWVGEK